nr:MAG TPA: hypothetical protein [Caudoviricetes sp.]
MASSKCKGGVLAMHLPYLDTDSQLYVVIDSTLSPIDTHDAKIIGIFNNKKYAFLFKESYKREYGVECFVMSGFDHINKCMQNRDS